MLKVENLKKIYPSFVLDNVSFELKNGYIMGFVGANGAGKSTTLKSMLNIIHKDGGTVEVFGKDFPAHELELKQEIGFMLGAVDYYPKNKISAVANVYKSFFKNWDEEKYQKLMRKFKLDESKKVCELSAGMKVKLGITFALSHNAKLLIFDEPTSGIDPVARDEILDIFQDIVEDGEHSILFSTHITSDLDKCADYILCICNGKLVQNDTKDNVIQSHAMIEGKVSDLTSDLAKRMVSFKKHQYGFKGLIKRENLRDDDKVTVETPNLEDIMVYYNRSENDD